MVCCCLCSWKHCTPNFYNSSLRTGVFQINYFHISFIIKTRLFTKKYTESLFAYHVFIFEKDWRPLSPMMAGKKWLKKEHKGTHLEPQRNLQEPQESLKNLGTYLRWLIMTWRRRRKTTSRDILGYAGHQRIIRRDWWYLKISLLYNSDLFLIVTFIE